jgi:hypothetical protein
MWAIVYVFRNKSLVNLCVKVLKNLEKLMLYTFALLLKEINFSLFYLVEVVGQCGDERGYNL